MNLAESALTSLGFFWKAGWAFVMGYAISAMIQAFVPRERMTRHLGQLDLKSLALSSGFGAVSSSCSFAALAAARALFAKGAHFVLAVAFMFASTNLVIELGILIWIFLGWQYLLAEILGGILLIAISAALMRMIYPERWIERARDRVEAAADEDDGSFDPWQRLTSLAGWRRVGHHFVSEWKMVWQEVLIGFTVAGFMKVLVPASFWQALFMMEYRGDWPDLALDLQNALVAPLVAGLTFIGSMGNIPLATVLAGSGVAFAGIMAFIYSDLMVPPLVKVNAGYYGWRVALYVAGIMYASAVLTALVLNAAFVWAGVLPQAAVAAAGGEAFALDYTFFLNLGFVGVAAVLIRLHRAGSEEPAVGWVSPRRWGLQDWVTGACIVLLLLGLAIHGFGVMTA